MWLMHYAKNLLLTQLAYSTEILVCIDFVSKLDLNDVCKLVKSPVNELTERV